ncbi:MAG: 4-hydroxythreonine-4-phosphate dehydrogenase PdxA [Bacteroidetes bacterium]|nr:4-hydroxythreonine-4-phosphate dehydrogenase PdxA [Bacteroidota bacterium]
MKSNIAITIGDFNGIGPEVTLKSLKNNFVKRNISPILIGSYDIFQYYNSFFKVNLSLTPIDSLKTAVKENQIAVLNVHSANEKNIQFGKTAPDAGVCAGLALEKAIKLCNEKEVDAIVTAPVSKEALSYAGYNFPGQTEMLALLTRSDKVTMMLLSKTMRVALATVHLPIKKIIDNISIDRLLDKLETVHHSLRNDFGIAAPRLAVLGLNPHAGENGTIGSEEKEIILPALKLAQEKSLSVAGPFSADGFFGSQAYKQYDAVLAMYHDQGLIPLKMSGFDEGINFSAGLKIIRTSPDHGTAYDIAGKGTANPGSMIAALELAHSIVQRRKK